MLFIGNQIRLTRAVLDAAVAQRRASLFQSMARQQIEAGANWLLLDMGPQRKGAAEDMSWLVRTIHDEVSVPLALRSDDPETVEAGLDAARDKVLVDATLPAVGSRFKAVPPGSATDQGLDPYLTLAERYQAKLAFSACPDGLPAPTEGRLALVSQALLPQALEAGLPLVDLYVDPLTVALSCDQPMVPATIETVHLLKVAADPAPNTLVHLEDVADGVADSAKPYITQAYLAMLLAVGVDALVANPLDPGLLDVIRVVRERDPATDYDRLLLRLHDVTKSEVELDSASVDESDLEQVRLFRTAQVLTDKLLYADSYLTA